VRRTLYLVFFALVFLGVLFTTPLGLGLSPDSTSYLKGSMGLVSGQGLAYVSAQWPPLYPTLVALFAWPTSDVILGARLVNGLFYAGNVVVLAELIRRVNKHNVLLAIMLAGLICIQIPMTYVHFYAWSEPCLLFCILTNLLLLSELRTSKSPSLIQIALIAFASLAFLTRFAGIIVAATNCVMILILVSDRSMWVRGLRAAVQLLVPILIFLPWTSHQGISDGAATARMIAFHPISLETTSRGLMTVGRWLNPLSSPGYEQPFSLIPVLMGVFVLGSVCAILIWALSKIIATLRVSLSSATRDIFSQQENVILVSSALLALTYVFFLIGALSFVDNKVALDNRILVLMYPSVILCALGLIYKIRARAAHYIILVTMVLAMTTALPSLKSWLLLSRYGGVEMNSLSVSNSPLQIFIKSCTKTLQVYADNPWNFDLHFNKKVLWLPAQTLYNSGRINLNYAAEVKDFQAKAQLVIIENGNTDIVTELNRNAEFVPIRTNPDGLVWLKRNVTQSACAL
jgi:4-amino-4-deoxy-L-arabinose transferase-like glycosyltransferase